MSKVSTTMGKILALILSVSLEPRNKVLISQLIAAGVEYEVVTGASRAAAREHYQINFDSRAKYSIMDDNQLACTYGHYLMFLRAREVKSTYTLFLEDDCTLDSSKLVELLQNIEEAPKGILILGACGGFAKKGSSIQGGKTWLRAVGDTVAGSHAYIIHESLINDFINGSQKLQRLPDSFHRDKKIKMFILQPYIAWQIRDTFSHIPLMQSGQSANPLRRLASSFKHDLLDRIWFGIWGGRFLRLSFLEKIVEIFYIRLPGCKD